LRNSRLALLASGCALGLLAATPPSGRAQAGGESAPGTNCFGCNLIENGDLANLRIGDTVFFDDPTITNKAATVLEIDAAGERIRIQRANGATEWRSARDLYTAAKLRERVTVVSGVVAVAPTVYWKKQALPAFDWPPPAPSTKLLLPRAAVLGSLPAQPTLQQVADRLTGALFTAGYGDFSFYSVPASTRGFALATRLEQFEADGAPTVGGLRWLPPREEESRFSWSSYLRNLFVAEPGFYRVIVFVVTDATFAPAEPAPSDSEAGDWFRLGTSTLPLSYAATPFDPRFRVEALIYEFAKPHQNAEPKTLAPGRLDARTHLDATGFLAALGLSTRP